MEAKHRPPNPSEHSDAEHEPSSSAGCAQAGKSDHNASPANRSQPPTWIRGDGGSRACDGIDQSTSASQNTRIMRNETVNSAPDSSNTLPRRLILSFSEVISNGFDLISEALMPGLQSDDFDNLSPPRREVSGSTDVPVDALPDVKMTSHRQNDTGKIPEMPDNVGSMLDGLLSTPHRHCLLRRSFSAPTLLSSQHALFKHSWATSDPQLEADGAALLRVPREDPSLPAVGTRSKTISSDIREIITAPELGVLPEEYGQDIQMTQKSAPENGTAARNLASHRRFDVGNPEGSPVAAGPRRMNIQNEQHRASNEIANPLSGHHARIPGRRAHLENNVEDDDSPISPHTRTAGTGFARQEAVDPTPAQDTQLQGFGFSPVTETGQSKLRRSTRGSFELEGDAWIPQTPKVEPSVGTSNGFEQLKKSLRMTPILKLGESPAQATKRRSTLQKPHRHDTVDGEQQGRKDSGGSLPTWDDENHASILPKNGTSMRSQDSIPPGRFAISSLASESSGKLPQSPPPRPKHKRSNAVSLDREEQTEVTELLKSSSSMREQDIAERAADNCTADSSVVAGKAVQPSLPRGHIRFAVPSSTRFKGTESAQDTSSNENKMNTQQRAAPGTVQQEHSTVEEPEEDMAEDIRIRTYAFNVTAQQRNTLPMYRPFPTPTRDQGKLAELLKAFDEQDIHAPNRRSRDEEIRDMRCSLLAERRLQGGEAFTLGPAGGRPLRLHDEDEDKHVQAEERSNTARSQPAQQRTGDAARLDQLHASDDHICSAVD